MRSKNSGQGKIPDTHSKLIERYESKRAVKGEINCVFLLLESANGFGCQKCFWKKLPSAVITNAEGRNLENNVGCKKEQTSPSYFLGLDYGSNTL